MKGTYLGEFEELVLLIAGVLFDDAYGVAIKQEIGNQTGRKVTLSTVHATLHRLEEKGYVKSRLGDPTQMRGGKRKRLFTLTISGVKALEQARATRNNLWESIPKLTFNF